MLTLRQATVILALFVATTQPSKADDDIFYYSDDSGQIFFSDQKVHQGFKHYGPAKTSATIKVTQSSQFRSSDIEQTIVRVASIHSVDANLVRAIVKTESDFNPRAVSHKGAMGLMQLMPETAKYLSVSDPFDPHQNIRGGVRYFGELLSKYQGDISMALAAYNAGPGAVTKYNGIPPYPETVHYIKRVLRYYEQLKSVS